MEGRPARLTGSTGELTECYERNAGFQNYWGEPHPLGSISLWKIGGRRRQFLPLLESTKFSKEKFNDPFLLTVIRPRRKTPGSPSIDDRGHNNCGIPTFLTKHGDKPLQSHQDIRGGGTAPDVTPPPPPSWSKMTSGWILSTLFRSRSYICRTAFLPRHEDGRPDFHETSLYRCLSSRSSPLIVAQSCGPKLMPSWCLLWYDLKCAMQAYLYPS